MNTILNSFRSWKTTGSGILAGLPFISDGISSGNWQQILSGIGFLLIGLFSKDYDVSSAEQRGRALVN